MTAYRVIRVDAAATRPLRHSVLRPTMTLADCVYPFDDDPLSLHVTCVTGGDVAGVASILPDPHASDQAPGGWRVRGMAVIERLRSAGMGRAMLLALIAHAARIDGSRYGWCSGRTTAQAFYERHGFRQQGEVYDQPPLGPHVVLRRDLAPADRELATAPGW